MNREVSVCWVFVVAAFVLVGCGGDGGGGGGGVPPLFASDSISVDSGGAEVRMIWKGVELPVVDGQAIVVFAESATRANYDELAATVASYGGTLVGQSPPSRMLQVQLADSPAVAAFTAGAESLDYVSYAGPNVVFELQAPSRNEDPLLAGAGDWWIDSIHSREAWYVTTGAPNVAVGIIDAGLDQNEIDFLFASKSGDITQFAIDGAGPDGDSGGHGADVFNLLAARGDDGEELVGMAWQSPVYYVDLDNGTRVWACEVIAGIDAIIARSQSDGKCLASINLSLGIADAALLPEPVKAERTARGIVSAAVRWAHDSNALVVMSAPNANVGSADDWFIPGSWPDFGTYNEAYVEGTIIVSAVDSVGGPVYSWSGNVVELSAPGKNIHSAISGSLEGNSFAAPFVTGTAALVMERLLCHTPAPPVRELKRILVVTADSGMLNAYRAVREPILAESGASLSGVSAMCSVAWGDYDSDGDVDLALAGDTVGSGGAGLNPLTRVYRNNAGSFWDVNAGLTGVYICAAAWGDYDGDGDLDLALAGTDVNVDLVGKIYRNDAGSFVDVGAALPRVQCCALAWGDYDNDGDLDLALAGWTGTGSVAAVYRNNNGAFVDSGVSLAGVSYCSLAWGDYDNDGDLDLAVAGYGASMAVSEIYRNDSGSLVDSNAGLPGVGNCSVAWGDYDNDGDLDLALAGDNWDGAVSVIISKVYRNEAGSFVDATAGLRPTYEGALAWGDYDNDGDLDIALTGYDGIVYRNDGGSFADIRADLAVVWGSSLAWGDYDDDGDLDLVIAGEFVSGSEVASKVYRNDCGTPDAAPTAPSSLSASVAGSDVTFSWAAASDSETPQLGLTHNLRVGSSPGGNEIMSGMAITSPEARLIPAMGNVQHNTSWTLKGLAAGTYYWSVQAIDTGFMGGPWAAEKTVTVP